jgi:hypothetical protein
MYYKLHIPKAFALPLIQTLHVSAQLAIIRDTGCRRNGCPTTTLLYFEFLKAQNTYNFFKLPCGVILLYAHAVGLLYILLVCGFFFGAVRSCSTIYKPEDGQLARNM